MEKQPRGDDPIIKVGFTINDMPLWLLLEFKNDIKKKYNDVYWTKLMDIMRKAQAYDYLMAGEFPEHIENEAEPEQEPELLEIKTMGNGSRYAMKKE